MNGIMNRNIKKQMEIAEAKLREKGPCVHAEVNTKENAPKILEISLEKEWGKGGKGLFLFSFIQDTENHHNGYRIMTNENIPVPFPVVHDTL